MDILKKGYGNFYILIIFLISSSHSLSQHGKPMTLPELSNSSTSIVQAFTSNMYTYYSMDKKHVYTEIELQIEESLKGNFKKGNKLKLITYGGKIDGLTYYAFGSPSFALKQEAIYFLSENKNKQSGEIEDYFVTGADQGKFDIFEDDATKKEFVRRNNFSLPIKINESGQFINSISEKENAIELEIFLQNIKNNLK